MKSNLPDETSRFNLRQELTNRFGFPSFRPGQEEAIRQVLLGRDLLVVMPTGAGKSLCYQLPALLRDGVTIVVSPLIALMKDQVDAMVSRVPGSAEYLNSSQTPEEQRARLAALRAGKYQLMYVAPERLRDARFTGLLQMLKLNLFVVDEAHCVSEWGHDFRPDYLYIKEVLHRLSEVQVLALTATATPRVQRDLLHQLGVTKAKTLVTGFDRENLCFEIAYARDAEAKYRLLEELLPELQGCGIVYAGTRRDTHDIAEFLNEQGRTAAYYHGGLEPAERTAAHEAFLSERTPIFAATKAFGMGIDKPNIRFIVHFSLPDSVESYYQEAGRSGRDGLPSRCVLLYTPEDRALQEYFIEQADIKRHEFTAVFDLLASEATDGIAKVSPRLFQMTFDTQETRTRVALSDLEKAGVLRRGEDEGDRMVLQLLRKDLPEKLLTQLEAEVARRRNEATRKLRAMIFYAETNQCRREFLLRYFGDTRRTKPERCCDNCEARRRAPSLTARAMPPSSPLCPVEAETATAILQAIHSLRTKLGRVKIVELLGGSDAAWLRGQQWSGQPSHGLLSKLPRKTIEVHLKQLAKAGLLKTIGGEYPVLTLTPLGELAIKGQPVVRFAHPAERQDRDTLSQTLVLLESGLSVEQVAARRGLKVSTILTHLAKLVETGVLDGERFVPEARWRLIEEAVRQLPADSQLSDMKARLPEDISYGEIRIVLAALNRTADSGTSSEQVARPEPSPSFLSRPHPQRLSGNWAVGYALDWASRFEGGKWQRTELGEMVFQLKYRGQEALAQPLAERLAAFVREHPEFAKVEVIVPVPPTEVGRGFEPVLEIARRVASRLGKPLSPTLSRSRPTARQKELKTPAQKHENVRGAFAASSEVAGQCALLLDDFFDSGETSRDCTRALLRAGARMVCVLTVCRTIHR